MNTNRLDSTPNGVPPEQYGAFGEVMANMTPEEQATVGQIAARANSRVAALVGAAPKTPFYMSPGAFIAAGALVIGLATWMFWPSGDMPAIAVADVEPAAEMQTPVVIDEQAPAQTVIDTTAEVVAIPAPVSPVETSEGGAAVAAVSEPTTNDLGNEPTSNEVANNVNPEGNAATPVEPKSNGPTNRYEDYNADGIQFSDTDQNEDPYTLSRYSGTYQQLVVNAKVVSKMSDGDPMRLDEMPQFFGGDKGIEKYVRAEVKKAMLSNPRLSNQTAMVMFKVSSKGKVSDIEIVSGDSNQVMQEVYRIFSAMPNWEKGSKKGKVNVMVAVTFNEPY